MKMFLIYKIKWLLLVSISGWILMAGGDRAEATDCSYAHQGDLIQNVEISIQDAQAGGITRTFDYYVPPDCYPPAPTHQFPLVFILHGRGDSADSIFATAGYYDWGYPWCRMMKEADEHQFIICAPDGWTNAEGMQSWNDCRTDSLYTPETEDVFFIESLINWFVSNGYNINANRVYAAGFSNGSRMVFRLAIELDDQIAAIAAVAGNMPYPAENECGSPSEKTGVFVMNGTNDPFVPYEGTQSVVDSWLFHNDLSSDASFELLPDTPSDPEEPSLNIWADLYRYNTPSNAEGTQVLHYTIHNGGHCEPSVTEHYPDYYKYDWGLGYQCYDFEIAEEVWEFFQTQSLAEERTYRPTESSVFIGSGSGNTANLWLNETDESGSYAVNDLGGEAALKATFTLPETQEVSSLRLTVVSFTTVSVPWTLSLWNNADGAPGSWYTIAAGSSSTQESSIEQVLTSNVSRFVNVDKEIAVALQTGDANGAGHQLMIDMMQIGIIYGSAPHTLQAVDDEYTIEENTPLTVTGGGILANDIPSTGVTALLVSDVQHGTLTLNSDGTFTYQPDVDFDATDFFTYQIVDGDLMSNTATVTIEVQEVIEAPVAADDYYTTSEDVLLSVTSPGVLDNDTPSIGTSALLVDDTQHGILILDSDGSFSYQPDPDFHGTDFFTYQASEESLKSSIATVTIDVLPINDAPIAVDDPAETATDTAIIIDILANDADVDEDVLTVGSIGPAASGGSVVNNADGTITYTPPSGFTGTDVFTYSAHDGYAESNTATVSVSVHDQPGFSLPPAIRLLLL